MKKSLLFLLIALFTQTANATIWLVNNNTGSTLTSVQAVLDSSAFVAGDTIMVVGSSTSYGNLTINIPVVLIGEGMNNTYGENTQFGIIRIYSSNVNVTGVSATLAVYASSGNTISNVIVERCYLKQPLGFNYTVYFSGGGSSHGRFQSIYFRNNVFAVGYIYLHDLNGTGGHMVEMDSVVFENNIFSRTLFQRFSPLTNLIGLNTVFIRNNVFIGGVPIGSPSVFLSAQQFSTSISEVMVIDNIFFASNPQNCNSCIFMNNLTFGNGSNDTISTGTGNIIATSSDTIFVNYTNGQFNFNQDFNMANGSPAFGAGTDGTNIGTTGGVYPLAIGEGARIPLVENISLTNVAEPQLQQFFLDLSARTRRHFNDTELLQEIKYSFDTILPFGQGIDLLPVTQGLNVTYTDSILPISLDSGLHTVTFIARDSKGAYSFPRTHTFNVCTYNEVVADFDYYLYGRDVIFANNSTLAEDYLWDFGDGSISNQSNPVHHYMNAATYTVSLNSNNPCFSDTHSKTFLIKGINSVSPMYGGNIGVVTMRITGAGFTDSTFVYLRKAIDIIPSIDSSTTVFEDKIIQTTFNLSGESVGLWDVVIVVPGDTIYELLNYFSIESGTKPIPQVNIVGNKAFRAFFPHKMSIEVTNTGNTNAMIVPIWFAVPDFVNVELQFDLLNPPDTAAVDWDTIPNYFIADTVLGRIGSFKVYHFLISSVAPEEVISLPIKISSNLGIQFEILLWAGKPWLYTDTLEMYKVSNTGNCALPTPEMECLSCIAGNAPNLGCIGTIGAVVLEPLISHYCGGDSFGEKFTGMNGVKAAASIGLSCGINLLFPGSLIIQAVELALSIDGLYDCYNTCKDAIIPIIPNRYVLQGLLSMDPNYKAGVSGADGSPYLNSAHPLEYTIHFENVDTATAAAQIVTLIDTLDQSNLDLSTFQLTSIGFADTIISIPAGRKSFTANVDLQPNLPLVVELSVYLNDSSGILTTTYKSLDPATMEPTINPFLGFLLPNDSTGRGEGFVSFSVRTVNNIATGSVINNKADIYFDYNPPIITPTWTNIIDNLKPQGQVISATQISSTDSINVSWASTDNGPAGVYVHNVYFNVNGGEWLLWKYNTSLNSDVFVGIMDSIYGFYSIAIDSALNIEDAPVNADAITTLTNIKEINQPQMIAELFPNPASNTVSIFIRHFDKTRNDFNIIATDIVGRSIRIEDLYIEGESKTVQIDISQFVSGVYFFEITDGTHSIFKKLIKK